MRGRHEDSPGIGEKPGNTPAYAGKTVFLMRLWRQGEKHPRVCGEDALCWSSVIINQETPPRMRGRRAQGDIMEGRARNTPAYAGKTEESACSGAEG